MFSKNLKYYRLRSGMSKKELAERVDISPMAISHYENGSRRPGMDTMEALADALGVRISDFLAARSDNIIFTHGEFRKNAALTVSQQELVRESVEEYFSRFMTAVEILGGDVLPPAPPCHALELTDDDERNAAALRVHLGISPDGPVEDLIGRLEDKGILIYAYDCDNTQFSGLNGLINERPYIVLNACMSTERNRSTIAHELAHLMFIWPETMPENDAEHRATAISGAFLFPCSDALRELGIKRTAITQDMTLVAREYGISMMLLVKRSELAGIVSSNHARQFYMAASQAGWRKAEPSRIPEERPALFAQLVFRAVNEGEISVQRGAELLKAPYRDIAEMCRPSEV